jgi:diadenosine tetraphosphate (Ap4A) HIT family hydrolase
VFTFNDVDGSLIVASNDCAFAIRDAFPVTDGHTLVISKRVVPTWWEATVEERFALIGLIDIVRLQLVESHSPSGFNVGFNAGASAGQTINHLHIHVIPRYPGDVADPRGGIRHVIPDKGNYLLSDSPI